MATSQPPSQTPADKAKLLHNLSLAAIVVCPLLIALPPRKFDFYTVTLLSGTLLGANQLTFENTGRSLLTRVQDVSGRVQVARSEYSASRKEAREQLAAKYDVQMSGKVNIEVEEKKGGVLEELRKREEGHTGKPQWKEERDRREREAAEEGKGIGDLIMDQIWEVVNWGKSAEDDPALKEAESKLEKAHENIVQERAAEAQQKSTIMDKFWGSWGSAEKNGAAEKDLTQKSEKKR